MQTPNRPAHLTASCRVINYVIPLYCAQFTELPYPKIGDEFASHGTVTHSAGQYVRHGGFTHTNTVESYFAILKRGVYGTFHNVSEAHLHRYLSEFDFRYNTRDLSDAERAAILLAGAKGKRLMYRPAH